MKVFIKENLVLITGITLPLMLALVFYAATFFDRVVTDPPQYKAVFATRHYYHNNSKAPYRLYVKDGQLRYAYRPPGEDDSHKNWQKPRLYVYNPTTDNTEEIELPTIVDEEVKLDQPIQKLSKDNITTARKSPDGYVFEYNYRSGGNLMTELFGGGSRYRSRYVLRKGSTIVKIHSAQRYYSNAHFIGWIVNEQED